MSKEMGRIRSWSIDLCLLTILILFVSLLIFSGPVAAGGINSSSSSIDNVVEEEMEVEFPMDFEIHRRILASNGLYSSVLNADRPACNPGCSTPGARYTPSRCGSQNRAYNC